MAADRERGFDKVSPIRAWLDVLFAAYAGISAVSAWFLGQWLLARAHGLTGLFTLADTDQWPVAVGYAIGLAWCMLHLLLPLTAIPAAIGLRTGTDWGEDFARAFAGVLLLYPPIGTLLALLALSVLLDDAPPIES